MLESQLQQHGLQHILRDRQPKRLHQGPYRPRQGILGVRNLIDNFFKIKKPL